MERFINLLIIDDDQKSQGELRQILRGKGNNTLIANSINEALPILSKKEIGILLINIDQSSFPGFETFKTIKEISSNKNIYIIALTNHSNSGVKMVKGLNEGAIDFITKPFTTNLVEAKIEVYKSLFYKDQRINQLLTNIFPETVLETLNKNGKFSPKKIENGVVLFTDFVNFSSKTRKIDPLQLLKKLEYYFTHFDEIIGRSNLEKIKTIGDSYMAIGGVTEKNDEPAIRACLAALEIRNFMNNEKAVSEAMNVDFWEIRIGINMGPLIAGIIGEKKFSFDVWGETVNIASRAELSAIPNSINVTEAMSEKLAPYFEIHSRGKIDVKNRGEDIEMFLIGQIKNEFSLYNEGKIANGELRNLCMLSNVDSSRMRKEILNKLKASLPEEIVYHDLSHTLDVEKAALRLAKLEGLNEEETLILRTAVLYHDAGYIISNIENEKYAINLAIKTLPKYGFNSEQIDQIVEIIKATQHSNSVPVTLLEKIMCDADHDYFGRADYYTVAQKLRIELENYGTIMTNKEWVRFQINYLENVHVFYTETAKNIRLFGKNLRIQELKKIYNYEDEIESRKN